MSVVEHPFYAFEQRIAAIQEINAAHILEWFKEAHDRGFSRRPLAELLSANDGRLRPGFDNIAPDLIAWCRARLCTRGLVDLPQSLPVSMEVAFNAVTGREAFARWLRLQLVRIEEAGISEAENRREPASQDEKENEARAAFQALSKADQKLFAEWALRRFSVEEQFSKPHNSLLTESIVSSFTEAQEAHDELEDTLEQLRHHAQSNRYWMFWPAWEIDGAVWDEAFGESNPAAVISFYLRSFFGELSVPSEPKAAEAKQQVMLTEDDQPVLSWLFDVAAERLSAASYRNPRGATASQLRRALLLRARGPLRGCLDAEDRDFSEVVARLPPELAGVAIASWPHRFPPETRHLKEEPWHDDDDELQEFAEREASFVVNTVLSSIGANNNADGELPELPDDFEIDYAELSQILSSLDSDFVNVGHLREELAKALIGQRDAHFEGVLPVSFKEAESVFEAVRDQPGSHWLSYIPSLRSVQSRYGVRRPEDYETSDSGGAECHPRRRALTRYVAYKTAVSQMQDEHLDELAAAWWAFFMATQAIAFGSFALPAKEAKQVVEFAKAMLPNKSMLRAIELARDIANKNSNLDARLTVSVLDPIILFHRDVARSGINVVELGSSREKLQAFLIRRLGNEVWSVLREKTRDQLTEAEGFWSRSYPEAGKIRDDWGIPVSLLATALEIELRCSLEPLLKQAVELDLCSLRELTLDAMLNAVRQAHKKLRAGCSIGKSIERNLKFAQEVLEPYNSFGVHRNNASHGNLNKFVSFSQYMRWRDALLNDGLMNKIIQMRSQQ